MALLKPIEMRETGVTVAYWRLTHLQMDCVARMLEAQLHGYRDEAARRAGLNPIHRLSFRFPTGGFPEPGAIALAEVYAAIRTAPDGFDEAGAPRPPLFADAADI
ncbi:hypothetical protein [Rubritepida flocculans]|uniref:hypothetical protein n=1 Tax=Rubritepida flocculans TaxID=182403 RepID=UPI00040C674A|nr:hypothetical protein [Rubritepida flocculans]